MKTFCALFVFACALWETGAYPYPYYGTNMDSISYGSSDSNRGGVALSRYYNPYYNPRAYGGGMAAFMFKPEERYQPQTGQYYLPDRRRQTQPESNYHQQNEVYYPQPPEPTERFPEQPLIPENPISIPELPRPTEATEIVEPTEKAEQGTTTLKAIVPELVEPETEELPRSVSKKRVLKKKQVKKPVEEQEDEDEEYPKMPTGAFFPMFFGWGGRSNHGATGGATAIANAYSTGRGGVATSHATAYGPPESENKRL